MNFLLWQCNVHVLHAYDRFITNIDPYAEPFEMVHQGYTKIAPRESMRGRGRLVTGSARPTYEREHSSGYESGGGGRGGEDMSYEVNE